MEIIKKQADSTTHLCEQIRILAILTTSKLMVARQLYDERRIIKKINKTWKQKIGMRKKFIQNGRQTLVSSNQNIFLSWLESNPNLVY